MYNSLVITEITTKYRYKLIIQAYKNWIKRGENILDVGCGDGIISERLITEFSVNLVGCDILDYLIRNIPFVKMNSKNKLPFKDNSFDVVMVNDVLHHMKKKDQIKIIKEALRLSPKVLIFEDKPTFFGKLADVLANVLHNVKMDVPLTFREKSEWENIFKGLDTSYETIELPRPLLYPFSHIAFSLKKSR